MSNDEKDEEMICALTADEHMALRTGLSQIPETMPPRYVWHRIREQAAAEGLLLPVQPRAQRRWYAGAGLAAAVLLAVIMMSGTNDDVGPSGVIVPEPAQSTQAAMPSLKMLQVQSRQLERDLRALPDEPRVARVSTVATLSEIEDRIAAIDYQLNDPLAEWADGDKEIFWGERVRLMRLLLQLRYAQAQRAAY